MGACRVALDAAAVQHLAAALQLSLLQLVAIASGRGRGSLGRGLFPLFGGRSR